MSDERTRRGLLRTGTGLAATTAFAGLAGCIDRLDGDGEDGGGPGDGTATDAEGRGPGTTTGSRETEDGDTDDDTGNDTGDDETAGDVPGYAAWLPAPEVLGVGSDGAYLFGYVDVAEIRENRDRFTEEAYEGFESTFGAAGVLPPMETIESTVTLFAGNGFSTLLVARGSFSADEAATVYTGESGGEKAGEHGDYTLYTFGEGGAAAVADGAVVVTRASGRDDPTEAVTTVVDAKRGEVDRLTDANGDAATLLRELGAGTSAIGTTAASASDPYDTEALSMLGLASDLNGDTVEFREVHVYGRAGDVDETAVREAATSDAGTLGGVEDVSVSSSGRVAVATGTVPTEDVTLSLFGPQIESDRGSDDEETMTPSASFDFEYDPDAGRVAVTHTGGDAFTDENTGSLRYGRIEGSLQRWPLPVEAGDRVTLEPDGGFESGETVVVVWEAPGGGSGTVVGRFAIP